MTLKITNSAALSVCDMLVAGLDGGQLRVYSGQEPADIEEALSDQVELVRFTLATPAFAAAVDINPGGRAVASTIDPELAIGTGEAAFFRIFEADGTTVRLQGSITLTGGGGDLTITNTAIAVGDNVQVTSLSTTMPEG